MSHDDRPASPRGRERGSDARAESRSLEEPGHEGPANGSAETGVSETSEPVDPEAASAAPESGESVDYRDRWLRTEADFQNFRKRAQRDLEEAVRFAEDRLLLETIGQLDDLERALDLAREAGAPDPWVQGVQLVANRMVEDLKRHGVTATEPFGRPFDPQLHEALLEIDAPENVEPGHVVQVVRKGYQRNGRALRAARVVVARREGDAA